jgi:N-methylhydantoinase B
MYALDLNPSILTEDGEFVYFGPYMQYMSGVTDTQVKWILEYRGDNPGIREGDMFLANDPWVGAAHQQDVMLICPVFWKGELFCWVTNCLHQYDIGGITPSSFCGTAESAFDEGICIPPVKIIEGNEIRRDIEELYLRSSRKPETVALDFRAQLAGNITARDRVLSLIRRYGPEVVKGVMKKIIDNGEAAFLEKLKRLPDGVWRERTYVECCRPGDRRTHRVCLTLTKQGDKLVFDNDGTAPQDGAMNATYSGWRGSIMVALNQLLCWDQYFCIAGALRHVEFDPTPGNLQLRELPRVGIDRAGAGNGDLALPRVQRALEDDPRRSGDEKGPHVHRRYEPVAGDPVSRHRPVGRALRLYPRRSDRRGDRRVLDRRRNQHRRAVAHADLQAAQRRAHRAVVSRAVPLSQGSDRFRRRGKVARRAVGGVLLHSAPYRANHA